MRHRARSPRATTRTDRNREVLRLADEGVDKTTIGRRLGISRSRVQQLVTRGLALRKNAMSLKEQATQLLARVKAVADEDRVSQKDPASYGDLLDVLEGSAAALALVAAGKVTEDQYHQGMIASSVRALVDVGEMAPREADRIMSAITDEAGQPRLTGDAALKAQAEAEAAYGTSDAVAARAAAKKAAEAPQGEATT